uniref:Uncharacterized protein n=1 Tax=Anguilla anguilla TaxID=7936 RepID=A0A0E9UBN5_ANGAN
MFRLLPLPLLLSINFGFLLINHKISHRVFHLLRFISVRFTPKWDLCTKYVV